MLSKLFIVFLSVVSVVLAILPLLVWTICWLAGRCCGRRIGFAPFGWTAVGLVGLFWLVMGYGYFVGRFQLETNAYEWSYEDLPSTLDGYRIVQISDLHLSSFDDRTKALQHIVNCINQEKPDLICFTGDLVTIGIEEAAPYTSLLRQLSAKDGVVSILGNHDLQIYRRDLSTDEERQAEVERVAQYERDELGWILLRDESVRIGDLTVVGVDNCSCGSIGFRTIYAGDLDKALLGTEGFRILLTHDPTHWRAEVTGKDVPLTLSGHTHNGQGQLFGLNMAKMTYAEPFGWFAEGKQSLYVNAGLGCSILPMRLNCPAEITIITLKKDAIK